MTSGEKRFARRLEHFLEDDYLCWYEVPVGGRSEHPDFIVLHPQRGLLILEVKDWRLETIRQIDRQEATILTDRGLKVVPNPLEQARQYAYQVIKPLERGPQLVHPPGSSLQGRLMLPLGHGVVLANITRAQSGNRPPGDPWRGRGGQDADPGLPLPASGAGAAQADPGGVLQPHPGRPPAGDPRGEGRGRPGGGVQLRRRPRGRTTVRI